MDIKNIDIKIDEIAKVLESEYGKKITTDVKKITRKFIPTGNPLVDWVFGRGLPVGRIIEIFGEEGVGKSTLAYQFLAEVYARKGIPVLFDTEESFDSERGLKLGLKKVIVEVPETIEQAFEMLEKTMMSFKEDDFGVVVWDSLTATPPESLLKGKEEIGARARAVSLHLQKLLLRFEESNLSLVILNQVRSVIGNFIVGQREYESPSARALKHEAVIRAELKRIANIKDDDVVVGAVIQLTTLKNKITSPFKTVKLVLFFDTGFSVFHSVVLNAYELGIVNVDKGWYEYKGKKFRKFDLGKLTKEDFDEILEKTIQKLNERYEGFYRKIRLPGSS